MDPNETMRAPVHGSPEWIAARAPRWREVLAQAEHDPAASDVAFCFCEALPVLLAEREKNAAQGASVVARIQRLRPRKGDLLVFSSRRRMTLDERARLARHWRDAVDAHLVPGLAILLDDGGRVRVVPWWLRWLFRRGG